MKKVGKPHRVVNPLVRSGGKGLDAGSVSVLRPNDTWQECPCFIGDAASSESWRDLFAPHSSDCAVWYCGSCTCLPGKLYRGEDE